MHFVEKRAHSIHQVFTQKTKMPSTTDLQVPQLKNNVSLLSSMYLFKKNLTLLIQYGELKEEDLGNQSDHYNYRSLMKLMGTRVFTMKKTEVAKEKMVFWWKMCCLLHCSSSEHKVCNTGGTWVWEALPSGGESPPLSHHFFF